MISPPHVLLCSLIDQNILILLTCAASSPLAALSLEFVTYDPTLASKKVLTWPRSAVNVTTSQS